MAIRGFLPHAVLVAAATLAPQLARPAHAQLLPDTGTTVQVGGLRQQLEGLLAPAAGPPPATGWTIVPALGLEQGWTDHVQGLYALGGSSFITRLLPSVLINGQTSHTNTTINYNPVLEYYSSDGNQNGILQNLNASSQITLLPERLFLDLNGFALTVPTNGGYAPAGTVAVGRQGQSQVLGFSAHPYLREHFGDLGSLEVGARVSYSSQNNLFSNQQAGPAFQAATTVNDQNVFSQQEYLLLKSGPDLGRTSVVLSVIGDQSTGTGGFNDSNNDEVKLTVGYAVTHGVAVLAALGYDTIHYGGYSGGAPYNQAGIEWSAGVRWDPNPDSTVVASYGRQDGVNSPQINISYAPTARSRVYARYSQGIATGLEQMLNAMNSSTLDPLGNPVSIDNGTPQQIVNNFFGVQNNLARVTNASATAVLQLDRDSFSASLGYMERQQLGGTTTSSTTDYSSYYASLNWQHDLRPDLKSFVFAQWGNTQQGVAQNSRAGFNQNYDTLVFSLRLSYALSETLNTYLQYSWASQGNLALAGTLGTVPVNEPTNLILIGVHKTF